MRRSPPTLVLVLSGLAALGCDDGGADPGPADAGPTGAPEYDVSHDFPSFHLEPRDEIRWTCQSWTVGNPEPLFVRSVRARSEGGFHHSNWFVVNELTFDGDDGTWDCDARGFEEIPSAVAGTVLFAQSTQSASDDQVFPPGTALRLRPRARIAGDVHLLNVLPEPLDTHIRLELDTVPESEVVTELHPMGIFYNALDIAARRQSEFTTTCDMNALSMERLARPLDAKIYYLLPHFHEWGTLFRVEIAGGPRDGEVVFESTADVGEPLGQTFDPPIDLAGSDGLRVTCAYDNPLDTPLYYGLADGEMCMMLAYTDVPLKFLGYVDEGAAAGERDGVLLNTGPCVLYGFPD